MGNYVTDAGFIKPTLVEIKAELSVLFQGVFGLGVDLDPDGPIGYIIGVLSKREATIWDGVEEVYTSRDPASATGVSLDNLFAEVGLIRLPASPTKVEDAILYGTEGAVVPSGSRARLKEDQDRVFALDADVTITTAAFGEVKLDPSKGNGTYTVTLDGTAYTVTVPTSTEKAATIDALIPVIEAAPKWEAVRVDGPLLRIRPRIGYTPGVLGVMAGYALKTVGSFGDFTATTAGALTCPAEALNEIATPVSGWTGVYNRAPGQIGREVELDEEFRLRRESTYHGGLATEAAILATVYNDVEGITSASIVSNRTDIDERPAGLPKKSFEVTAVGGTDLAVAQAVWKSMPAGMESFGNVVDSRDGILGIKVIDSQGYVQRVYFSRPNGVFIWIRSKVRLSTEDAAPSDWQTAIKDSILAQVGTEIKPGKDVIYQNLFKAIYKVEGIDFVDMQIAAMPDSLTVPAESDWIQPTLVGGVWTNEKILVSPRNYADFDAARISVEGLA